MPRRSLATAVALLAALSLGGCATFDRQDTVAEINGTALSQSALDRWLQSKLAGEMMATEVTPGAANGGFARSMVTLWIQGQLLAKAAPNADRAAAEKSMADQYGDAWKEAPADLQQLATDFTAAAAEAQSGGLNIEEFRASLAAATIYVNPRVGVWNRATGDITGHAGG